MRHYIVWGLLYVTHIVSFENVQRNFLKIFALKSDGMYPEGSINQLISIKRFEVDALQLRRIKIGMTFLDKLHNNFDALSDI